MWEQARPVREKARAKLIGQLARLVSKHADPDRVLEFLASIQELRSSVEEVQNAFWHLTAMPTRYDVRKVQRRVIALRRRTRELELALARLEAAHQDDEE
jgi:hypothetical protein